MPLNRLIKMRTPLGWIFGAVIGWSSFAGQAALELRCSTNRVPAFEKVEFVISGLPEYPDAFDPAVVDVRIEFTTPDGRRLGLPAFFAQDYERGPGERGVPRDWAYPAGKGRWKARFTPSAAGKYRAVAVLKEAYGETRSETVSFDCMPSSRKGFVRIAAKDPRFFEFDNGEPFFAIGQNLAFIGEQQYVTMTKAEQIFASLSQNGANYLRVWTCAEDWALAIEARKSAWGRSWSGKGRIVAMPDDSSKNCLLINASNSVQEVNPSHRVPLRPSTRYVVTGKVRTDASAALRIEVHGTSGAKLLASTEPLSWTAFQHEFSSGPRDWWLGQMRFRLEGNTSAWLRDLSLEEASGSAELLWEAEMNRPTRGFFNPLDCFLLDELVSAAERHGIYLQLCMLTRDLYMKALKDGSADGYTRAIADAKKFFRYAIARWGYSTSVAAWEYWNEMDPGLPTDRFYTELGQFFEQADIYHHLRRTSTWGPSPKDCRHADIDVADVHFYLRPVDKPRLANEVDAVLDRTRWLREQAPNRPVQIGEFGLADDKWRITDDMKRIPDLSDLHNALWASALSGASGTALPWWWERIDQRDGYAIYGPVSRFIADVPWNSGGVQPLQANCSDETIRIIGLRAGNRAWFWLFDPAAAWSNVAIEKQTPPERRDISVELTGAFGPTARVMWWDTRKAAVVRQQIADSTTGILRIQVPSFRGDIAISIAPD